MTHTPTLLYLPTIFGIGLEVFVFLALLGLPTFFFWRWLFKKLIKVDQTRKVLTWATTILLTPLIYIGIVVLWLFSVSYYPSRDFDRQQWLSDREKRYELSEYLIESKLLLGKTKAEVRELLGDEGNADEANYWIYYLGFRPQPFGIDPDVLDIEFQEGKVIKVGQHET